MPYLKLLTAPLIIISGLALLTACGGGGISPTINIGEININNGNPCDTQPFGDDCGVDYEPQRVKKIGECLMGKAADTLTCAPAINAHSCIDNPFATACASNTAFADYLTIARTHRTTYCETNPDETAFCADFVNFNRVCSGNTDIFNLQCSTDSAGRRDICEMHGITTDGHATCVDILVGPCVIDPFTNSHCESARDIGGIRDTYCGDPATAWDDDCVPATYSGTADARDMACLQYGIDANAGGNALCAMRPNVLEACDVESPFAYTVCDEVAEITGFRTTFCQIPANAFTTGCQTDGTHGDVDAARDDACLMDLSTATGCAARPNVGTRCTLNPLSSVNPGCVNLPNHGMLLSDYCALGNRATRVGGCGRTAAAVCPNNAFNPSAVSLDGTIDCLADPTFAPARRTACATGDEETRCDTPEIAPEVCKASGASANPFAAFCTSTTNIGGGNIAEIRQTALTACFDGMSDGDNDVCQNTAMDRSTLTMNCAGAVAFETLCDYTEYAPQKTMFCEDQTNTWNVLCDGGIISSTPAMRDAACVANANADIGYTGSDLKCAVRPTIIMACDIRNPFRHSVCNKIVGINDGVRKTFCETSANAWNPRCMDGTHGTVASFRTIACLDSPFNDLADPLCATDMGAVGACRLNPFDPANPGCANLMIFQEIVGTYCEMNPRESECTVKTSAWVRSFGEGKAPPTRLTATTPATERQRQFLTGLATGLDTTGTFQTTIPDNQKFTLTLDSARYNGEPLGGAGDASDGVAAFFDNVDTGSVYYAGILLNTDLGAPLTQTDGSVTWYGQIQIFRQGFEDNNEDFQLKITFGTNPAVNGSVGSIEGIVKGPNPNNNVYYQMKGTYDAGGVITGTVNRGNFTGSPLVTADTPNGILTGLIGEQGAVGVFLAASADSTKDNIEGDGNSGTAYGGGFVVAPYVSAEDDDADKVTFRDWLREFDYPLPTSSAVEIARTTSKPHFIRPKTDGTLDLTGVTGTTQHKATRAGDDKDGFAYGVGKIVTASTPAGIGHSFVGILPSTDLGAPLTEAIAIAKWPGQFSFGNTATLNDIEFTLTFDGTNSGTIDGMFGFVRFDLDFDGKGIITGDVTYSPTGTNPTTTVARGLIGEEGLVGVFTNINNGNTAGIEFGGFVAAPPVANQAAWLGDFEPSLSTTLAIRGATLLNRARQFLAGGETELDPDGAIRDPISIGLTFNSAMYDGETLSGNSDFRDGFAGFADVVFATSVGVNANVVYYAGLLSGTDLGAPLTDTIGGATLYGQIQILRFDVLDTNPNEDFQLKIVFGGASGEAGSIAGLAQSLNSANAYHLTGTYDAGGIITGTVTFGTFTGSLAGGDLTTTASANGILTGLIGEHGAVGAFLAGGGTKEAITGGSGDQNAYVGGFVAARPYVPETDDDANKVTFRDWRRDFGSSPPPTTLTATEPATDREREFLAGGRAGLATTGAVNVVTNVTANLGTGNTNDGYHYFIDRVDTGPNIHIPYAGLLSGTDLGAPITGVAETTAVWNGTLKAHTNLTVPVNEPLELKITYGGTNGEMGSIAGAVRTFTTTGFELKGTYDASGVISGTVYHGIGFPSTGAVTRTATNTNGILTGLIGAQGAVGVFLSGTGTKEDITAGVGSNYVGGFVAAYTPPPPPPPPPPRVATHATFKTYYAASARAPERTLQADLTTGGPYAFVEGTATSLPIDGLTFPLSDNFMPITVRLKEEATGNNGFAVMYGLVSGNQPRFRAGLLSETDLGPALSGTSTATWAGSLHWANAVSGLVRVALDTVTVDFDNGTIKTPAVTVRGDRTVAIDGLFRAGSNNNGLDVGILGGDAIYTDGVPARLPLIGLIGTEGAIGVYHDGTSVVGGFQASPN